MFTGQNKTPSLTLGGYDASRFQPAENASFYLDGKNGVFSVNVQSIIAGNTNNSALLPQSIPADINPQFPDVWLPSASCDAFETAFSLAYDSTSTRYILNETLHKQVQSENASISFMLSTNSTRQPTVNITFPYASFDLAIGPPILNTTQRYFPLRRSEAGEKNVLGRALLQEV